MILSIVLQLRTKGFFKKVPTDIEITSLYAKNVIATDKYITSANKALNNFSYINTRVEARFVPGIPSGHTSIVNDELIDYLTNVVRLNQDSRQEVLDWIEGTLFKKNKKLTLRFELAYVQGGYKKITDSYVKWD